MNKYNDMMFLQVVSRVKRCDYYGIILLNGEISDSIKNLLHPKWHEYPCWQCSKCHRRIWLNWNDESELEKHGNHDNPHYWG